MNNEKRIIIVIGHYGSGKTEFAVNYAMKNSGKEKIALVDLDIVNVYFRSREKADMLEKNGVTVISGALGHKANLDIPAISSGILGPLQDKDSRVILDVGGDSVGARALARYKAIIEAEDYEMLCVFNGYREQTQTVEGAIYHIKSIEIETGLKVTGIVNNTHMLRETSVEDVVFGENIAKEVSKELNIPIKYTSTLEKVARQLPNNTEGEIFPIKMYMREEWM
jgi:hypothetical protein